MPKITRRTALARGGQAVAVAAATAFPVISNTVADAAEGDAEMVSMWHKHCALEAKYNAAAIAADRAGGFEPGEKADALLEQAFELTERILVTPARTPAGIAVKLKSAVLVDDMEKDVKEEPMLTVPRAVLSALADAERLAGRA